MRFNRFQALKDEVKDGNINFAMSLADFHLQKNNISREQFEELEKLAYPLEPEVEE